jgi:hypothetical protein
MSGPSSLVCPTGKVPPLEYASYALGALAEVKSKMTIGASNKPSHPLDSLRAAHCVDTMRTPIFALKSTHASLFYIKYMADAASKAGCGNCEEQSAIAFMYLWDKGIRPLEWVQLLNGNHRFVVIGRDPGDPPQDPAHWAPASCVCDPWNDAVYPASTLKKRFGKTLEFLWPEL